MKLSPAFVKRLAYLHSQCHPEEMWYIERVPHYHDDGKEFFTHVRSSWHDAYGGTAEVEIGQYLEPDLAELLTLMWNNLPELLELAEKGLESQA